MGLYKPWKYIDKATAQARKNKKLQSAFREVEQAGSAVRDRASAGLTELDQVLTETDNRWNETSGRAVAKASRAALRVLDAPREYVGKPVFGVSTGRLGAEQQQYTDENGNTVTFREGDPTWGDFGRGIKKLATSDPRDTYQEARRAFDEGQRDPNLASWQRIGTDVLSDPTLMVGPGGVGRALPAGVRSSRGARVAASVIETPRRVAAGAAAGSAAGEYVAERTGAPEWLGSIAGGVAGGGFAAKRRMSARERWIQNAVEDSGIRKRPDLVKLAHGEIRERPDLFQARDADPGKSYKEARVKELLAQWDPNQLEPGALVHDTSTGEYIVFKGHHRRELMSRQAAAGNFGGEGTWEVYDADLRDPKQVKALERLADYSNTGVAETNLGENVKIYRRARDRGESEAEIFDNMRSVDRTARNALPHIASLPDDLIERGMQAKMNVANMGAIGKAAKAYGWSEREVRAAFGRYGPDGKSQEITPTQLDATLRAAHRKMQEMGPRPTGGGLFGDDDVFSAVLGAADEVAEAERTAKAARDSIRRLARGVRNLNDPELESASRRLEARLAEAEANYERVRREFAEAKVADFEGRDRADLGGGGGANSVFTSDPQVGEWIEHQGEPFQVVERRGDTVRVQHPDGRVANLQAGGDLFGGSAQFKRVPKQEKMELEGGTKGVKSSIHQQDFLGEAEKATDTPSPAPVARTAEDITRLTGLPADVAAKVADAEARRAGEDLGLRLKSDPTAKVVDGGTVARNSGGQGQFGVTPKTRPDGADAEFGSPSNPLEPEVPPVDTQPPSEGIGPGNPQPQLGQEEFGADLLRLPDRDTAIAKAGKFAASRTGKVDTAMRENTFRLLRKVLEKGGGESRGANIVKDGRITPIWEGINQAENTRQHLMSVVEEKMHALSRSGLRIVQREDGNWVEANSGLPWSDIVEQDSDAAKAAWAALTDEQRKLTTDLTDLQQRATETRQRYGSEQSILEHEGEHWSRRVESIAGVKKPEGLNSSRRIGATRGVDRSRAAGTAAEGIDRQMVYAHPFDSYRASFDEKLKAATDGWVEMMAKPLAKEGAGFATLNVPGHPGLSGLQFDPDVQHRLQAGLAPAAPNTPEALVRGVNSALTPIKASMDLSATFQQGMAMWVRSPARAAKLWTDTIASMKNPDRYFESRAAISEDITRMLDEAGIKNAGGSEWLIERGLRQTAEGVEHEFALPRLPSRLGKAAKGYNTVADLSQEHFDRLLNLYRLETSRAELKRIIAKGGDIDGEMTKANRAINRLYGWDDGKPTSIESIGLFAPRFFRSNLQTIYKAVAGEGIERDIARDYLLRMVGVGVALTITVNSARGYETELDPRESNFMRIRNVGGVDVSPFGPYDTLLRYMVTGAYETITEGDPAAFADLARAKSSPVLGQAVTQVSGKTFDGRPVEGHKDRLIEALLGVVPFPAANVYQQGYEAGSPKDAIISGTIGGLGLKNSPMSPSERRDEAREKVAENRFGSSYGDLPANQKSVVNEDESVKRWQSQVDERQSKGDGDRATEARIRQMVGSELDASAKFLADGRDANGNPYTGNDFRKAYNDTMLRAAGARQVAGRSGSGELDGWFRLYDEAKMANGQVDYDVLERLQAEYRSKHPDIDAKLEKDVGVRDNAAVRELREARKQAAAYYAIPRFRRMTVEESERAGEVLRVAADMVKFGQARNRGHALRIIRESDPDGADLAKLAIRRGSNPERKTFRESNVLFAKFYSDAPAA